jgi:catechol 2,3-dioxygenase-like lactoylglutathione lyase family enzyme
VLEEHLRLLRTAVDEEGGHEIDTRGDSLFAAFPRAKNAALAAAAAQRALAEHDWPAMPSLACGWARTPARRWSPTIGVAVHDAARVCSAAHGGQVLLSQSTAAVLKDDPVDGMPLRELGHHQLKDFKEPERIFQLVIPGLRTGFPALRAPYYLGRLIDHVHLRVRDLEASKRFYRVALEAVGHELTGEGEGYFEADELYASDDGEPTARLHLAFQAPDRDTVDAFYEATLAVGGRDNGAPRECDYHSGYYAAYVLDPDGNNVEAVYHGPATRSVESVVVTPEAD